MTIVCVGLIGGSAVSGEVQSPGFCTLAKIFVKIFCTTIVNGVFFFVLSNFGTSKSHSLAAGVVGSQRVKISSTEDLTLHAQLSMVQERLDQK